MLTQNENNIWTKGEGETLEVLLQTHFPGCSDSTHYKKDEQEELLEEMPNIFTNSRIEWAIKSFKPYKSPGPDGIYPAMLQNCFDVTLPWLKILFTTCIKLNTIPKSWREARVVFIPKTKPY